MNLDDLDITFPAEEKPVARKWTSEQEAIREAAVKTNTSLMIDAKAGCGKTTTLEMLSKALPIAPSLALAFNVKIKKELEKRFPSHFNVMTLNGLGHNAWGKAIGRRCAVDTDKLKTILNSFIKENSLQQMILGDDWSNIMAMIRGARQSGLIPAGHTLAQNALVPDTDDSWCEIADSFYFSPSEDHIWVARSCLIECIRQSYQGVLDFDDQIYMSALFNGAFPKYRIVLVDEAQDLSPLNHMQLARTAGDRIIVCGDPRQAIYAFRGADSASMGNMRKLRPDWIDLPLGTTFRCPKAIVARQQQHAPGFVAAPSAPEGAVLDWMGRTDPESGEPKSWTIEELLSIARGRSIGILCRNNAPIIAAALRIISKGRGCTVLGGEIGKSLINLSNKVLPSDATTREAGYKLIEEWRVHEVSKARAMEKEERVPIINDRAECLVAVFDHADTAGRLRHVLKTMFSKDNLQITLATGHKSKGLEWPIVVHLDPWRVPSKYARKALDAGDPTPMEQDLNLRYVIETRTMDTMILANLEDFA